MRLKKGRKKRVVWLITLLMALQLGGGALKAEAEETEGYTVTFDAKDGMFTTVLPESTDDKYNLLENGQLEVKGIPKGTTFGDITKDLFERFTLSYNEEGYTAGWYIGTVIGEAKLDDDTVLTNADAFEVYAKWEKTKYNATVIPDYPSGDKGKDILLSDKAVHGENLLKYLSEKFTPDPEQPGYEIGKWSYLDAQGNINDVTEDMIINDDVAYDTEEKKIKIKPIWQGKTYEITLNENHEGGQEKTENITYKGDQTQLPGPEWEGHDFLGWCTEKINGDECEDIEAYKITGKSLYKIESNPVLYACWRSKSYKVTLRLYKNGENWEEQEITEVKYGTDLSKWIEEEKVKETVAEKIQSYSGHSFDGWYLRLFDESEGGTQDVKLGDNTILKEDVYLYAHWKEKYKVTFNVNGETCNTDSITVTLGEPYGSLPVTAARTGYTFAGWQDADGKTIDSKSIYEEKGDSTLFAKWRLISYSLSYNLEGGKTEKRNPDTYNIESDKIILVNPIREGYVFEGWSGTDLKGNTNKNVMINRGSWGNRSYTAHWKKNQPSPSVPDPILGKATGVKVSRSKKDATQVTIRWKAAENAQNYKVCWSTKKKTGYKVCKTVGKKTLTCVKGGLKPGRIYYFRVVSSMQVNGKTVANRSAVSSPYKCIPKKPKLRITKVGDQQRLSWGKMEKGTAGIEIRKNNKFYAGAKRNDLKTYEIHQERAPKGTSFKIRVYFQAGKKRVYSPWSNTVKVKN
ncbi:MAG: InlB B-repeat-containing protein [Lachnospiraceae bacterium]|jgi:uncharacterized repeat protein (TIGR02543 family)|nr:InlB B-repeat-containing protein [Lachnospiraceae bacterium]